VAHRDFAGRSGSKNKKKAKKSFNRNTLIGLALVVVLGFGLGLYFLKNKTPEPVVATTVQPEKTQPKNDFSGRKFAHSNFLRNLRSKIKVDLAIPGHKYRQKVKKQPLDLRSTALPKSLPNMKVYNSHDIKNIALLGNDRDGGVSGHAHGR